MKIRIVSGWKTLVCIAALCCGGLGNVMAQDAAPITEVEITATVTEATPAASAGRSRVTASRAHSLPKSHRNLQQRRYRPPTKAIPPGCWSVRLWSSL